jgi:hypothetical protein
MTKNAAERNPQQPDVVDATPGTGTPMLAEELNTTTSQDDSVAKRAYERYLERGSEHGRDQEDWFEAEREIRGRR